YESLQLALNSLTKDLEDIKAGFCDNNGNKWNIKLYFSVDWKMLALCLGHKAANSNNFCLWYGHTKKLLFPIITIDYWVVDELHLLLRITDRLWSLIISELKTTKQYDLKRKAIMDKMKQININFEFWQEEGS
ncbi:18051_t:CDS:2, partial [Gigaspora margarita]